MAYNNMDTIFTDNITGEEYEFLGTNITFSERALMNLESEYDQSEEKRFVARLISDGYFEEEWTDYYAQTDDDDEDDDEDDEGNQVIVVHCDAPDVGQVDGGAGAETMHLDSVSVQDADVCGQGTFSQSNANVPVFIEDSTVTLNDEDSSFHMGSPVVVTRGVASLNLLDHPRIRHMLTKSRCHRELMMFMISVN